MTPEYELIVYSLRDRILALIPCHPEIMNIESCWDLFKIPEFECRDLGPSMAQAGEALYLARHEWRKRQGEYKCHGTTQKGL